MHKPQITVLLSTECAEIKTAQVDARMEVEVLRLHQADILGHRQQLFVARAAHSTVPVNWQADLAAYAVGSEVLAEFPRDNNFPEVLANHSWPGPPGKASSVFLLVRVSVSEVAEEEF